MVLGAFFAGLPDSRCRRQVPWFWYWVDLDSHCLLIIAFVGAQSTPSMHMSHNYILIWGLVSDPAKGKRTNELYMALRSDKISRKQNRSENDHRPKCKQVLPPMSSQQSVIFLGFGFFKRGATAKLPPLRRFRTLKKGSQKTPL